MSFNQIFDRILRRPKIDYVIVFIAYMLIASNQIFVHSPLTASGSIDVTNGSPIPQDSNYSISYETLQSVSSAILFNETVEENGLYFYVSIDNVSKMQFNVTLTASSPGLSTEINIKIGNYHTSLKRVVSDSPTTYSLEPNLSQVRISNYWFIDCYVHVYSDASIDSLGVVMQADYTSPVSPIVFDFQSSDGSGLYDNPFTRHMSDSRPELNIERFDGGQIGYFYPTFQNYTLFLTPQNYSIAVDLWGSYYTGIEFNVSISENVTSYVIIRMNVIRLYFSVNKDSPIMFLSIRRSSYDTTSTYRLFFEGKNAPEFLYLPNYSSYIITVQIQDELSNLPEYRGNVIASVSLQMNITHNLNISVSMPYVSFFGLFVTPQDLVQIFLAMFLYLLLIFRLIIYIQSIKPRTTWKDSRLIPILIIAATSIIPWFSTIRFLTYPLQISIHTLSMGPFPLLVSWTPSSGILLRLLPNGLMWGFVSLLLFWIPVALANYLTTPPSTLSKNCGAALILFSPLLFLSMINWSLSKIYAVQFGISLVILGIECLVPLVFLLSLLLLKITHRYDYGPLRNQLSFDFEHAPQIDERREKPSSTVIDETPFEEDKKRTLNLVLLILYFLLAILPTSICSVLNRPGSEYVVNHVFTVNPIISITKFIEAAIGIYGGLTLGILSIPCYYYFTFAYYLEFSTRKRIVLSIALFILWISFPFLVIVTLFTGVFSYVGVEWIAITLPYFLISFIATDKMGKYIQGDIRLSILAIWIVLSLLVVLPGTLVLQMIADIQVSQLLYIVPVWWPLPLYTILLVVVIFPLKRWFSNMQEKEEIESELHEIIYDEKHDTSL